MLHKVQVHVWYHVSIVVRLNLSCTCLLWSEPCSCICIIMPVCMGSYVLLQRKKIRTMVRVKVRFIIELG